MITRLFSLCVSIIFLVGTFFYRGKLLSAIPIIDDSRKDMIYNSFNLGMCCGGIIATGIFFTVFSARALIIYLIQQKGRK